VRRYVLDLTIAQISFCSNNKLVFVSGVDHFEILTFTTNIESFKSFVMKIYATGGGDAAEDVVHYRVFTTDSSSLDFGRCRPLYLC
jgi:hypothetical protein